MSARSSPARAAASSRSRAAPRTVGAISARGRSRRPAPARPAGRAGSGPATAARPRSPRRCPRPTGVEAPVGGEQLIGAQPRIQPLRQRLLPHAVGVDLGGHEGVGAALGQRDHPRLGQRRAVAPSRHSRTRRRWPCCPVGRSRTRRSPAVATGAGTTRARCPTRHPGHRRGVSGDRAARAFEQLGEHLPAQALAGLGNRRGGRHPDPAAPSHPRSRAATVPARPANTSTPRRAIKNYQLRGLINLRYMALGLGRSAL